jgi:hypothetical protein
MSKIYGMSEIWPGASVRRAHWSAGKESCWTMAEGVDEQNDFFMPIAHSLTSF